MNANDAAGCLAEDDLSLAKRIATGDFAAFAIMMRRYNKRLYRLARACMHNEADAKDALQDAYVSAFRSIEQFRGQAALSTWLSRLVINECGARRRRSARRDNILPIDSLDSNMYVASNVTDDSNAPESTLARTQVREILESKVTALPDILRIVFVMRSVEELSVQETAESLGVSQETVRTRHFRAKALLRASLEKDLDSAEREIYEFGGSHCDALVASVLALIGG